jgi:hypothetical protein
LERRTWAYRRFQRPTICRWEPPQRGSGHKEGPSRRVPLPDRNHTTQVQNTASRGWSLSWARIFQENRNWCRCRTTTWVWRIDIMFTHVLTTVWDSIIAQLLDVPRESHIPDRHLDLASYPHPTWHPSWTNMQRGGWATWQLLQWQPPVSSIPLLTEKKDPVCWWIPAGVCHHHRSLFSPCPHWTKWTPN